MAFFSLKLGLNLEMRAAHPHQKFQGVPPLGAFATRDFAVFERQFQYCTQRAKNFTI